MKLNTVICGDCLEIMRDFPDNSVDSIVTDPPYGISFMGKKWDYKIPSVAVWKECLRVLKPGGHALIACGTRTQHRMAVNIEDAGFEIRDIVAWIYGSGFPKSLNIGKAVDKLQGNEREVVEEEHWGRKNRSYETKSTVFSQDRKSDIKEGARTTTKGNSPYEGWGTALKPAMELWTLCRKPLEKKTVAQNVLKHGTGGINIDGCRVGTEDKLQVLKNKGNKNIFDNSRKEPVSKGKKIEFINSGLGRFPANLIQDGSDEVIGLFPDTKSGGGNKANKKPLNRQSQVFETVDNSQWNQNFGSAARFFYCAKASKAERNKGLEGLPDREMYVADNDHGNLGHYIIMKAGGKIGDKQITKNNHPTVKPISLMRYLCRLITPKGGTVLDCFAGSGSTGVACKLEGFDFIGIEKDSEYAKIAEARIKAWKKESTQGVLKI